MEIVEIKEVKIHIFQESQKTSINILGKKCEIFGKIVACKMLKLHILLI